MGVPYLSTTGATGTLTLTATAATQVTWNLSYLSISQAGPTVGPNGKVTVWDGAVGTGTAIFTAYLSAPGAGYGGGVALGGSVGIIQEIPLPMTPDGKRGLQNTPGNALNIQVTGTGANLVAINARVTDGLP